MQQENHLEAFKHHLIGTGYSRATADTYYSDVNMFLQFIGKGNPKDVTPKDVEAYCRHFKEKLAITSHRVVVYAIILWLNYIKAYYKNNTINHFETLPRELNPLRPPRKTQELIRTRKVVPLTQQEENLFIEKAKGNPKEYLMFSLFFITMQRGGSILNIDDTDIDLNTKQITIYAKGNRTYPVDIDDDIVTAIEEYRKIREKPREGFVLDNWDRKKYHNKSLFLNGWGIRPSYSWMAQTFKRYAKKLEVERHRWHSKTNLPTPCKE